MKRLSFSSRNSHVYGAPSQAGIELENLLSLGIDEAIESLSREQMDEDEDSTADRDTNPVIEGLSHPKGEGYQPKYQDQTNTWPLDTCVCHVPWALRPLCLLGFLVVIVSLIIALEVLSYIFRRDQGLATSTQIQHYFWTYGPTAG